MKLDLSTKEKELLKQSYEAYSHDLQITSLHQRKADALKGIIVSDFDADDPEQYVGLSLASDHLRLLPGEGSPFGEELATSKLNYWLNTITWERKKASQ